MTIFAANSEGVVNRSNFIRVVSGLFLALFVTYYANATLFGHCHIINGVTIVHSHFHAESHHATPSGGHSVSSLTLIAALNMVQCTEAAAPVSHFTVDSPCCDISSCVPQKRLPETLCVCPSLRAPPVLQYRNA